MNEYETFKKWVNSFDEKIYYKIKPPTKKELYEIAIKQEEEIEKLNNIIKEVKEYIKEKEDYFYNYPLVSREHLLNILEGVDKE